VVGAGNFRVGLPEFRFNGLQVARGVAAVMVVLYHVSVWSGEYYHTVWNGFFNFGYIGVDFFFVLSGFLIYYLHREDDRGWRAWRIYYAKRLIRIYPPFLPITLMLLACYWIVPVMPHGGKNVGLLSSLLLIPSKQSPALTVSWTLMHEMLFYTFFSVYFFSRRCFFVLAILWIVVICLRIQVEEESDVLAFLLSVHNIQFFLGVAVSFAVDRYQRFAKRILILGLVCILWFVLGTYFRFPGCPVLVGSGRFLYLGLAFACIVYGVAALDSWHSIPYPGFFLFLGAASYSIYLVHFPALSLLNRVASLLYPQIVPSPFLLFFAISALCLVAGVVYYVFYEQVMSDFLKRRYLNIS